MPGQTDAGLASSVEARRGHGYGGHVDFAVFGGKGGAGQVKAVGQRAALARKRGQAFAKFGHGRNVQLANFNKPTARKALAHLGCAAAVHGQICVQHGNAIHGAPLAKSHQQRPQVNIGRKGLDGAGFVGHVHAACGLDAAAAAKVGRK